MSIIIKSEYTGYDDDVEITCFRGDEPHFPEEIDTLNGVILKTTNMSYEELYMLQNKLFDAFCKQKEDENKYNELHYSVEIDIKVAKKFLYEHYIENYGIIDNLIYASIHENNINVKYKINNNEYEFTFYGCGYELLKSIRLNELECGK